MIRGRARVYPRDHVNTDEIIPARYLVSADAGALAEHVLEGLDPEFPASVRPGDVLVAGEDFGCGSSREHAVWALAGAGVAAVVAGSFARLFFRNSVNNGFPAVACPGATDAVREGDEVVVDLEGGTLRVPERDVTLPVAGLRGYAARIVRAGGLLPFVAARRGRGSEDGRPGER